MYYFSILYLRIIFFLNSSQYKTVATQQATATAHRHQPTTTATAHNPKHNSKQNQTNPAKYLKQIHLQKHSPPPQKFQPPPWYNNSHNPNPMNPIWKITQDLPLWVAKITQPNHHRTTTTQPPSQSIPPKKREKRKKKKEKNREVKLLDKEEEKRKKKRGKESARDRVAEKERR